MSAGARDGRDTFVLGTGLAALAILSGAFALRQIEVPGLYYDEVIQAVPALAFVENRAPAPIPGRESIRLAGRWFPLMTQPYMGALKSQALIAPIALFGASPATLRWTTWLWTLCGIGFAMWLGRELLGTPAALLAGALLALDPSVLFAGRHDWGSFALGFLCRGAGLWLLVSGWRRGSALRLALGGLALGLGVFNKIDFAVFLAAAAAAWLLAAPRSALALLRTPRRALPAAVGLALGAAPMLAALPGALEAGRAFAVHELAAPQWTGKLVAFVTTLDGSYFQRLILAGGVFEELGRTGGSSRGLFLTVLVASLVYLTARLALAPANDGRDAGRRFLVAAVFLGLAGYLLTPNAERIHHVLLLAPCAQLACAAALLDLWRLGAPRQALRIVAIVVACATLLASARVDWHTASTLAETGGRGRWSDALTRFASGLGEADVVVALDWGFAEPLRFLAPERAVIEPIWELRRRGAAFAWEGSADTVYLVQPEPWAVFGLGPGFLEALAALPPEAVTIEEVRDRGGATAFLAARIARPHRLDYRGSFVLRLR